MHLIIKKKTVYPMKTKYLVLISMLLIMGCYKDKRELLYPGNNCDTSSVTFVGTIQPILSQNCAGAGCHQGAASAAGIDLSNYSGTKIIADNGKLIGVINHSPGFSPMPKNMSKLSDCDINKISAWVNKGALNN